MVANAISIGVSKETATMKCEAQIVSLSNVVRPVHTNLRLPSCKEYYKEALPTMLLQVAFVEPCTLHPTKCLFLADVKSLGLNPSPVRSQNFFREGVSAKLIRSMLGRISASRFPIPVFTLILRLYLSTTVKMRTVLMMFVQTSKSGIRVRHERLLRVIRESNTKRMMPMGGW
jgi:hypothetical protein